jgi:hypothetical protein
MIQNSTHSARSKLAQWLSTSIGQSTFGTCSVFKDQLQTALQARSITEDVVDLLQKHVDELILRTILHT